MAKDVIIRAEELHFSYDDRSGFSLNGFSIEIERGARVAFMGPNGAGKSTFFLCLNGIHRPDKGRLCVNGKPVTYEKRELIDLRSKVGIVFQDPDNQLFSASVFQEISFGPLNMGMSREDTAAAVNRIMQTMGITHFKERPAHSLSGGEKKQVSIADIIVMDPDIVVLDEPAAFLDPKHSEIVDKIIGGLTDRGVTVLIATHDVEYAYEWADKIAVVNEGKVEAFADPAEIFRNKELISKANLRKPSVLEIFDRMREKGIFDDDLKPPVRLEELEKYIDRAFGLCE